MNATSFIYQKRIFDGSTARIGRYTWNIYSPLFGKFYVDIVGISGSMNDNVPESFDSLEQAMHFVKSHGYVVKIEI